MHSIHISKNLLFILLIFVFTVSGSAQDRGVASDRAAGIQSRQLRFVSQRPVEHLRLQVHSGAGALIHDSGVVAKSDLVWSLSDANGKALKAGVYDWTLTIKEPGVASPRIKRGQFDLENTNEPISPNSPALAPIVVDGKGTAGTIPIWTTATELGNSVILQENDHLAIGSTPGANIRLRVYLMPEDQNSATALQAVLQPSKYVDPNGILTGWSTGQAVAGYAESKVGGTQGVYGESNSNIGIGVWGNAKSTPEDFDPPLATSEGIGVKGTSHSREGIGVLGIALRTDGENVGVRGESKSNTGVGVLGEINTTSGLSFGVKGINSSPIGRGVLGYATNPNGVNFGVFGRTDSPSGYAGYFIGRVHVAGLLTKAASTFKIDHPLDPENKYLSHSVVESPDMMNIYNGIVTLDRKGAAEVILPDWFEALNREFRYQLTPIGGFAPVYVASKVNGNRFKIAGGRPGMEVSWQLTGVRKDAYAERNRVQIEELKAERDRGLYLHPEAFGKSEEKSIQRAHEKLAQN